MRMLGVIIENYLFSAFSVSLRLCVRHSTNEYRFVRTFKHSNILTFKHFLKRRDAPATKSSGCLSEGNPKGSKGLREAEIFTSRKVREVREVF